MLRAAKDREAHGIHGRCLLGDGAHLTIHVFCELEDVVGIGAPQVVGLVEDFDAHAAVCLGVSFRAVRIVIVCWLSPYRLLGELLCLVPYAFRHHLFRPSRLLSLEQVAVRRLTRRLFLGQGFDLLQHFFHPAANLLPFLRSCTISRRRPSFSSSRSSSCSRIRCRSRSAVPAPPSRPCTTQWCDKLSLPAPENLRQEPAQIPLPSFHGHGHHSLSVGI